jgi:DNA-directed RNA polymerase subunit beta'
VIINIEDCGTQHGLWIDWTDSEGKDVTPEEFRSKIIGRILAAPVYNPETGELIADTGTELADNIELEDGTVRDLIAEVIAAGQKVFVRSVLTCEAVHGVCQLCYGRNLATGKMVDLGEAVGIVAAQSIGEPGTQLTMRTFHSGGVARADITTGLPRVEELFEARQPKNPAILAEREGEVSFTEGENGRVLVVSSNEQDSYALVIEDGWQPAQAEGTFITKDKTAIAEGPDGAKKYSPIDGDLFLDGRTIYVRSESRLDKDEYAVPVAYHVYVEEGDHVIPGQQLTDGAKDPQQVLLTRGREDVQRYIIDEVQKVYKSQGVSTNDKHIEVICRQMLRKVSIIYPGDTDFLQDERIDRFEFNQINEEILAEGGEPATAMPVLLGITKASLETDSFLAAASFQETTRVLTEAAINGKVDQLRGLKENVIIGKLIPAGSGFYGPAPLGTSELDEASITGMLEDGNGVAVEQAEDEDLQDLMTSGLIPGAGGDGEMGEGEFEGFQTWTSDEDPNS